MVSSRDGFSTVECVYWARYLCLDVVKRRGADDGEADEEDVGLGVRERPQSVVVLLSGGIPKPQAYWLSVYHDICRVVVEAATG